MSPPSSRGQTVWYRHFINDAWQEWRSMGAPAGAVTYHPGAASWGPGINHALAHTADGAFWHAMV